MPMPLSSFKIPPLLIFLAVNQGVFKSSEHNCGRGLLENRKTQQLKFEFDPNIDKTRNLDQNVNISYTIIVIQNRKDEIKNPIRAWILFLNN